MSSTTECLHIISQLRADLALVTKQRDEAIECRNKAEIQLVMIAEVVLSAEAKGKFLKPALIRAAMKFARQAWEEGDEDKDEYGE